MSTSFTTNPVFNQYVNLVRSDKTTLAVTANTNIFATDFAPASAADPIVIFVVYVVPQAAGVLSVRRTTSGTATNQNEAFNNNGNLAANGIYIGACAVGQNDTINLRYSVSTTFTKFMLVEIP